MTGITRPTAIDRLRTVYSRCEGDRFSRSRERRDKWSFTAESAHLELEGMLDLSLAVRRSKMVVIAFWLLCRDRPECISCLLGIDRKPNGSDGSITYGKLR